MRALFGLLAGTVLLSSVASAYTCPEWVKQLEPEQTYAGEITYDSVDEQGDIQVVSKDPSLVKFKYRPKNCTIVGTFEYTETIPNGKRRVGQFSQVQPGKDGNMSMVWHDVYGFGLLDVTLNKDLSVFKGSWYGAYTNEYGGKWDGARESDSSCWVKQ